jgi:hypothetical protein
VRIAALLAAVAVCVTAGAATGRGEAARAAGASGIPCPDLGGGLPAKVKPKRAGVQPGQTARFTVSISNERDWCPVATQAVGVCMRVNLRYEDDLRLSRCKYVRTIEYGATRRVRLWARARLRAEGRYRLHFRVFESMPRFSIPAGGDRATLRVRQ